MPAAYELAQTANTRYLAARETALSMAEILERIASSGQPVAPGQILAVAMKIRREIHEA